MLFEREQDAEEGGFGQLGAGADVLEGEWGFAVEAIEDVEGAADGAQIVLLAGGGVGVCLERPLGDAATDRFFGEGSQF